VPLVSESVWANAGTAAVQSTINANHTFTCHHSAPASFDGTILARPIWGKAMRGLL
jgi:hypothetical protein